MFYQVQLCMSGICQWIKEVNYCFGLCCARAGSDNPWDTEHSGLEEDMHHAGRVCWGREISVGCADVPCYLEWHRNISLTTPGRREGAGSFAVWNAVVLWKSYTVCCTVETSHCMLYRGNGTSCAALWKRHTVCCTVEMAHRVLHCGNRTPRAALWKFHSACCPVENAYVTGVESSYLNLVCLTLVISPLWTLTPPSIKHER